MIRHLTKRISRKVKEKKKLTNGCEVLSESIGHLRLSLYGLVLNIGVI